MSFIRITDTRIMQSDPEDVHIAVKEGAQNVAYIPLTSASLSTSNCTFNLNNIATEVCRSRRQCMRITGVVFTVNVTQTSGTNIFDSLGFHSWPLNRAIANLSHQINQASYSLNLNQIIDAITKFDLESENANFFENTAYDAISNYTSAYGSALDPLQPYASNPSGWGVFKPRSNNISISTNVGTGAAQSITITCNFYEPLCSPFNNVGKDELESLYAINGEILQIQFVNNLFETMMAYSLHAGAVINSVTTAFPSTATLDCIYLTPNADFVRRLPQSSVSHYNNYSVFSIDAGQVNSGQSISVTSPVCQLTNMPFKILVYARQSDATRSGGIPDRYLTITNVQNCSFDNGSNQLSASSIDQLFELSSRNGCVLDRSIWQQQNVAGALGATPIYGCGSILALDPKLDLGVRADVSDGSPGRYIFQITLSLKNNTADVFAGVTLYVVAVTNAVLERNGSEYRNYLYSLPASAVMDSKEGDVVSHVEFAKAQHANMFLSGGSFKSFFSKVWRGVKKAGKWAWKHRNELIDAGKTAYKVGKTVGELAGKGEDEECCEPVAHRKIGLPMRHLGQHMGENFSAGRHPTRRMDLFYQ